YGEPRFRCCSLQGTEALVAQLGLAASPTYPAVGWSHRRVDLAAARFSAPGDRTRYTRLRSSGNQVQTAMKWAVFCVWLGFSPAPALALTAYVTNERDNTISVVDLDQMKTVKTVQVGQRPRGITMTKDGSQILVCASDDDTIQIIDTATLRIIGDLPSGPDPETFALHVSGNPLYVSNEDDNMITVIDVPARKVLAQIPTGVEAEGMAVSPDGQTIVNTSETTNMAHFLDVQTRKMVAAVLVDARPRVAMFKHDGSEVWVSSELGGTVN